MRTRKYSLDTLTLGKDIRLGLRVTFDDLGTVLSYNQFYNPGERLISSLSGSPHITLGMNDIKGVTSYA